MVSRYASQRGTVHGSGQKNGLLPTSAQSQRARSMAISPIWTRAPRMVTPGSTLAAMAPAATRIAVSRAEERPPPRWSRMPYLMS